MRKSVTWGLALACVAAASAATDGASANEMAAGQTVFASQGCDMCHAVPAAGIEAKMPALKAPPLPGSDAPTDEWTTSFLRGEVEKDGKPHAKKFTGSDEELATLLAWLRGLAS